MRPHKSVMNGLAGERTCEGDAIEHFPHEAEDDEYTGVHKRGNVVTNTLRAHADPKSVGT